MTKFFAGCRKTLICAAVPLVLLALPLHAADFTFGIYGVSTPEQLRDAATAGFNVIQSYENDPAKLSALAAEAKRLGVSLLIPPDKIIGSSYQKAASRWPVKAWYIFDEPDVAGISAAQLRQKDAEVKAALPAQRTAFVTGQGSAVAAFGTAADIVMTDWYPVPHMPAETVGREIAIARSSLDALHLKGKPLWAVLQAFDWRTYPQKNPSKPRIGRLPTADELRLMTYSAVLRGASGVFYFTYAQASAPQLWLPLQSLSREMHSVGTALSEGTPFDTGLTSSSSVLLIEGRRRWFKKYIVVINTSPDYAALLPRELVVGKKWRPLFESSRYPARFLINGRYLRPLGVLVFER